MAIGGGVMAGDNANHVESEVVAWHRAADHVSKHAGHVLIKLKTGNGGTGVGVDIIGGHVVYCRSLTGAICRE